MYCLKKFIVTASLALACLPTAGLAAETPANPIIPDSYASESFIQDAYEAASKGVEVTFPYFPQQVFKIYTQLGFVTDIKLEPGEVVKYVGGGDTVRWQIDTATTGSVGRNVDHIYIKPMQNGINTNIVINTDKRSYQLIVEAGHAYNPMVSWIYPKSDVEIYNEQQAKGYSSIDPTSLKFGYKISNKDYKWSPAAVFRSENKTYFKMKSEIKDTELPAIFAVDDEKKLLLVSYRFTDGYFIVDRVLDEAVLIAGGKKVKVKYRYEG